MPSNLIQQSRRLLSLTLAGTVAGLVVATPAQADITGNIAVVSKYVLRGITNSPENNGTAVQGGLDYAHSSGLYLGYWGSNLSYADPGVSASGFENDLYGGYKFKAGPVDLNFGLIYYLYNQIGHADTAELLVAAGVGPVTFGAKILTQDVAWGNQGDIYWTVDYTQPLPKDFKLAGTLGAYTYKDSGKYIDSSSESTAFRHLNLALSHPLGKTGADMAVTYIIGGKDRQGAMQSNAIVLGVSAGF
jgi:uncharacterized protein (TIGR02001 family)